VYAHTPDGFVFIPVKYYYTWLLVFLDIYVLLPTFVQLVAVQHALDTIFKSMQTEITHRY